MAFRGDKNAEEAIPLHPKTSPLKRRRKAAAAPETKRKKQGGLVYWMVERVTTSPHAHQYPHGVCLAALTNQRPTKEARYRVKVSNGHGTLLSYRPKDECNFVTRVSSSHITPKPKEAIMK
jgi:hypothetical protein